MTAGATQSDPRPDRIAPSERVLACLNAAADTDITLLLSCQTGSLARKTYTGIAGLAAAPPYDRVGARARGLERVLHRYAGSTDEGRDIHRIGPIDLIIGHRSLIVRWSHLAGDAWSLQEFVLEALTRAGLLTADSMCTCASNWPNGPHAITGAEVWDALALRGVARREAVAATWPAVAPLLRPLRAGLPELRHSAPANREAIAMLEIEPRERSRWRPSRFSQVAALVLSMLGGPRPRTRRLGVTVDLRRHELLHPWAGVGNISCVGYVSAGRDQANARAVHAKIQRLVGTGFWRQQVALDAWLRDAPAAMTELVANAVVRRLAGIAPVTVTELWRDDAPRCLQCGRSRRSLPDGIEAIVVPPALAPAGLTVGITRSANRLIVVMRRLARPGESASAWLRNLLHRGAGRLEAGGAEVLTVTSLAEGFPVQR